MKILGRDFSAKWINFELDGKEYSVHFKDNFIKGTHDISIWGENGKIKSNITSAYPNVARRILELALVIEIEFKYFIKRRLLHNQ